jgi:hypothetical protein
MEGVQYYIFSSPLTEKYMFSKIQSLVYDMAYKKYEGINLPHQIHFEKGYDGTMTLYEWMIHSYVIMDKKFNKRVRKKQPSHLLPQEISATPKNIKPVFTVNWDDKNAYISSTGTYYFDIKVDVNPNDFWY